MCWGTFRAVDARRLVQLRTDAGNGGKVYSVGVLTLKSNDTVYIEEGAVVSGCVYADHCDNISIVGNGIINGACWQVVYKRQLSISMFAIFIVVVLTSCAQVGRTLLRIHSIVTGR